MKSTGIVRKIDELGRVVIPKETRRILDIKEGDPIEFYIDGDRIVLRKYEPSCSCIFCGSSEDIANHKGKPICKQCVESLSEAVS